MTERASLCLILHRWENRSDAVGCYGMGLETFETQQCGRCGVWRDRVKGTRQDGRRRYPWFRTDRPPTLALGEEARAKEGK